MAWYINDLSLAGQYCKPEDFLADLKELMGLRQTIPVLGREMYCSRNLHTRWVSPGADFRQAVQTGNDKHLLRLVLEWINKRGPFWDDARESNEDDYFECRGDNVTDQGLGEAARCQLMGKRVTAFSFPGKFDYSPVEVVHGLPEAPINKVLIGNFWRFSELQVDASNSTPFPVNWAQMLDDASNRFDKLVFLPTCIEPLKAEPFSKYVVERAFELLGVLQDFMASLDENGRYTARTSELIDQHFRGEKSWFSDESETNKRDFSKELSFPDSDKPGVNVFCPWHGKIKTPQYRIHFEWPVCAKKLRIFYIGPKITKR